MNDAFLTFKVFANKEAAEDMGDILQQNEIGFLIEEDILAFDPSYAMNEFNKDYRLKIRQQDFEMANKVLGDYYKSQLDKVSEDYYLFGFTNDELREIVAKPDEWGDFDYQLSQKLLAERGKEINPEEKEALRENRIVQLSQPEIIKRSSIIFAYIICFFFFPVGVIIGRIWSRSKKTLPNGQRVYVYNINARKHGRRIFTMGIVLLILSAFLAFIGKLLGNDL